MKRYPFLLLFASVVLLSCQKEKPEPTFDQTNLAPLSVEFDNIVGGENLYLHSGRYVNSSGEPFTITQLQYYISNIQLEKADGTRYIVPQDSSYFLIKESEADTRFARVMVPEGDYARLTFTVGVDSLRSTMDIDRRTGVLDPGNGMDVGMYWGWNSGYIFFKMEGLSDAAPVDASGQQKFRYHIGGFGGYDAPTLNNIREVSLDLSVAGIARVRKDGNCNIHLMVDISKVWDGEHQIRIADNPAVMFSEFSALVADNYANMFNHDHTEN